MEALEAYIPIDRRLALLHGTSIPEHSSGAALFADISGFTPLTEALVRTLGPQRGAEELPPWLNRVYDALIVEVERYGGVAISFAGDAITCWFAQDHTGLRATACALALQRAMAPFAAVTMGDGKTVSLAIKVAVAAGSVRRFLVGDPAVQLIEVLAGSTLDRLVAAEHQAQKAEVILDPQTSAYLEEQLDATWRVAPGSKSRCAVVRELLVSVAPAPWPALSPNALAGDQIRPWLLPPVYERLRRGMGEFLTELRPATALFLRFGGIDYDSDPRAGSKLDSYVRWVQEVLARYGGFLIQLTTGDKGSYWYAAFGAPLAHGDDVARAVAAALELRAIPERLGFVHVMGIGIGHGRMRTGAYGGQTRRTYGVLGDEVNLAARLMQQAPPRQVLVSAAAQKQAAQAFRWEQLPALRVKGKRQAIKVFRLLGTSEQVVTRLTQARYTLPLIGREAELRLIAHTFHEALAGRGQILSVIGEAGIGKSRLIAEAVQLAQQFNVPAYIGECQSYGTHTSYLVWHAIWRGFFGLLPEQSVDAQIAMLEQQLSSINPQLVGRLPLLGAALNLPIAENELTRALDAKLRKQSLEALLVDCLRARARSSPILFVLDDCHWLDPLSNDLLEAIGRALTDLPVLIVTGYRPPQHERDIRPRVDGLPHGAALELSELTPDGAAQLIRLKLQQRRGPGWEVPEPLIERITSETQGNPFYIEELLNYLQDRKIDAADARAVAQIELPTSLQSLILSRIDQLTESQKLTLKVASVIGRSFQLDWLWGVHSGLGEREQVLSDLEELSRLDLTPLDQPEPVRVYLFKHMMTREVAYESQPFATRAVLHGQLAEYIERTYRDDLEQQIDLLAHHYWLSNNEPKKREYLHRAGEVAQAAYANEAAIDYFSRLLPLLPAAERRSVLLTLGQVLELVGRWAEAGEGYHQSLIVAEQAEDLHARAECQAALGDLLRKRGDYAQSLEWLAQAREGFERCGEQVGLAQVLKCAGTVAAYQSDYATARNLLQQSLELSRATGDESGAAKVLNNLAVIAQWQQDFATAVALNNEALELRRRLGDKPGIAMSLNNLGLVMQNHGDFSAAQELYQQSLLISRELGDKLQTANASNNLGWLLFEQGAYTASRTYYDESLALYRDLGDRWGVALALDNLGRLLMEESDYEQAHGLLEEALALKRELGDRHQIAVGMLYLSQLACRQGDYRDAVARATEGLALCRMLADHYYLALFLKSIAFICARRQQFARALLLAAAGEAILRDLQKAQPPVERQRLEHELDAARQALGREAAAKAWAEGEALAAEQAVELALQAEQV